MAGKTKTSAPSKGRRKKKTGRSAARSGSRPSGSKPRRGERGAAGRRWSQRVTEGSDALTLEQGVFALKDPKRIAASLKRSAEESTRRKSEPFRSAMSMLTFYINRAGRSLPASRKRTLMRAKEELRRQFGRT